MAQPSERPDFVVDPDGTVHDVRHLKFRSSTTFRPAPEPPVTVVSPPRAAPVYAAGSAIPVGLRLLFVLLMIVGVPVFYAIVSRKQAVQTRVHNRLTEGEEQFWEGDYAGAIASYSEALRMQPGSGQAYNNRALAYYATGDYERAIADLGEAIAQMPGSASPYSNRGLVHYAQGAYGRALADLGEALERNPSSGKAYYIRGLVYCAQRQYDRAIADLDQALAHSDDAPYRLPTPAGPLSGGMGDWWQRMQALGSKADPPLVYVTRGMAYSLKGAYREAIADYTRALALQPDLAPAYYGRAAAYQQVGELDKAGDDLARAFELGYDQGGVPEIEDWIDRLELYEF